MQMPSIHDLSQYSSPLPTLRNGIQNSTHKLLLIHKKIKKSVIVTLSHTSPLKQNVDLKRKSSNLMASLEVAQNKAQ